MTEKIVVPQADELMKLIQPLMDTDNLHQNGRGETIYVTSIEKDDAVELGKSAHAFGEAFPSCVDTSASDKNKKRSATKISIPIEKTARAIKLQQYDLAVAQSEEHPEMFTTNVTTRVVSKTLH